MACTAFIRNRRLYALLLYILLVASLLILGLASRPAYATPRATDRSVARTVFNSKNTAVTVTVLSNNAPAVGLTQVLYDGMLGGTPDTQGFFYLPLGQASSTWAGGVTTLNTITTTATQAGYANAVPPVVSVPASFPVLNRTTGYTLRFSAQVISETHPIASSDRNGDGIGDRAGFSVIAISSDGQWGIELGFWTDQIWAQNDGVTEPPLFTHGESANFNTTAGIIPYELRVLGNAYSLAISNTEILSGSLRNYTAFSGSPDVYETPNFIFFGDNTASARAIVKLSHISAITEATLPGRTTASNTPLVIDKLGLLDIDAGGQTVVMTMTVNSGALTLTTTTPGGLTAGQISGNGSSTVVAAGSLGQINSSLAFSPALIYRSQAGFFGVDTATVTVNDRGHTGSGGALIGQKSFTISVQASAGSDYLPVIVRNN